MSSATEAIRRLTILDDTPENLTLMSGLLMDDRDIAEKARQLALSQGEAGTPT